MRSARVVLRGERPGDACRWSERSGRSAGELGDLDAERPSVRALLLVTHTVGPRRSPTRRRWERGIVGWRADRLLSARDDAPGGLPPAVRAANAWCAPPTTTVEPRPSGRASARARPPVSERRDVTEMPAPREAAAETAGPVRAAQPPRAREGSPRDPRGAAADERSRTAADTAQRRRVRAGAPANGHAAGVGGHRSRGVIAGQHLRTSERRSRSAPPVSTRRAPRRGRGGGGTTDSPRARTPTASHVRTDSTDDRRRGATGRAARGAAGPRGAGEPRNAATDPRGGGRRSPGGRGAPSERGGDQRDDADGTEGTPPQTTTADTHRPRGAAAHNGGRGGQSQDAEQRTHATARRRPTQRRQPAAAPDGRGRARGRDTTETTQERTERRGGQPTSWRPTGAGRTRPTRRRRRTDDREHNRHARDRDGPAGARGRGRDRQRRHVVMKATARSRQIADTERRDEPEWQRTTRGRRTSDLPPRVEPGS